MARRSLSRRTHAARSSSNILSPTLAVGGPLSGDNPVRRLRSRGCSLRVPPLTHADGLVARNRNAFQKAIRDLIRHTVVLHCAIVPDRDGVRGPPPAALILGPLELIAELAVQRGAFLHFQAVDVHR